MATWKKLIEKGRTSGPSQRKYGDPVPPPVFVNMDLVYCIQPEASGSRLFFVSDSKKEMHVSETADQIMMAPALQFNTAFSQLRSASGP
jgi:hypothetical protein